MVARHIRQSCSRKQRHTSYNKALAHAKSLFRQTGEKLKPYSCTLCDGWHIGHPMNDQAQLEWERNFNG